MRQILDKAIDAATMQADNLAAFHDTHEQSSTYPNKLIVAAFAGGAAMATSVSIATELIKFGINLLQHLPI